jgi:hypothetical protein
MLMSDFWKFSQKETEISCGESKHLIFDSNRIITTVNNIKRPFITQEGKIEWRATK